MVVWLPAQKICLCGNTFGPVFGHIPNLVTMRGDRYRDALTTIAAVERVRELRPEVLITGHFEPITGAERIHAELTRLRDAIEYVHDRTVEGMNAGKDVHTLMREITLPPELDVGEGYGKVSWDVRAIWENYSGWFHHRSTTELYDVGPDELSAELVELVGAEQLVTRADEHVEGWPTGARNPPRGSGFSRRSGARGSARRAQGRAPGPAGKQHELLGNRLAEQEDRRLLLTARITFDFTGTDALITGGTSGIGHATATLFRDAGAQVTITGTKAGPGDYDVDLAGMTYRQLILTDVDSINELVSTTTTLDVLVNNAGANFPGGLNEAEPDGFDASVALNLTGPYRLTVGLRKALSASTAAGGASVVNLSSLSALRAVTMVPGYGAAKAGIISVTQNLAVKWAKRNIRVNAVVPGVIDTPMTELAQTVPEIIDAELARIPMGRVGRPGEIAHTIAFLCTEHSSYTSGALFIVDGASTSQ